MFVRLLLCKIVCDTKERGRVERGAESICIPPRCDLAVNGLRHQARLGASPLGLKLVSAGLIASGDAIMTKEVIMTIGVP